MSEGGGCVEHRVPGVSGAKGAPLGGPVCGGGVSGRGGGDRIWRFPARRTLERRVGARGASEDRSSRPVARATLENMTPKFKNERERE